MKELMTTERSSLIKLVLVVFGLILLTDCGKKKDDLSNIGDNSDVLYYQDLGGDCDEGICKT